MLDAVIDGFLYAKAKKRIDINQRACVTAILATEDSYGENFLVHIIAFKDDARKELLRLIQDDKVIARGRIVKEKRLKRYVENINPVVNMEISEIVVPRLTKRGESTSRSKASLERQFKEV